MAQDPADKADAFLAWARRSRLGRAVFGSPEPTDHNVRKAASVRPVQRISANVIRACPHCQAPGTYINHPSVFADWPGCWVGVDDPRLGQRVGLTCPNCNQLRRADEPVKFANGGVLA